MTPPIDETLDKPVWAAQRERGHVWAMQAFVWCALLLGRRVGRLLLFPICAYFMLFSHTGRRASRGYLARLFGRQPTWREVFRHHYAFASTLLDRAFLLRGRAEVLAFTRNLCEPLYAMQQSGQGCLLLGAHMGSFEVTRYFGAKYAGLKLRMLMYQDNAQKVSRVARSLAGGDLLPIIPLGGFDALFQAKEALDRGEVVGLLGDRVFDARKYVEVPFLGQLAAFPTGPFLLAHTLKVPVVLFFGLYTGGNRYVEHAELFAERITIDPAHRQEDLARWVQRYAERLEHYCRAYPYNWFNFYDFWARPQALKRVDKRPAKAA